MARAAQTLILLASDEYLQRTLTQNAVVLGGSGPKALIQKEKLFNLEKAVGTTKSTKGTKEEQHGTRR